MLLPKGFVSYSPNPLGNQQIHRLLHKRLQLGILDPHKKFNKGIKIMDISVIRGLSLIGIIQR